MLLAGEVCGCGSGMANTVGEMILQAGVRRPDCRDPLDHRWCEGDFATGIGSSKHYGVTLGYPLDFPELGTQIPNPCSDGQGTLNRRLGFDPQLFAAAARAGYTG